MTVSCITKESAHSSLQRYDRFWGKILWAGLAFAGSICIILYMSLTIFFSFSHIGKEQIYLMKPCKINLQSDVNVPYQLPFLFSHSIIDCTTATPLNQLAVVLYAVNAVTLHVILGQV